MSKQASEVDKSPAGKSTVSTSPGIFFGSTNIYIYSMFVNMTFGCLCFDLILMVANPFNIPRLGPSASQVNLDHVDDEKLSEVVKAISYLQSVMPLFHTVMGALGGNHSSELADADAGRPAPARPKTSSALTIPYPSEPKVDKASSVKPEAASVKPEAGAGAVKEEPKSMPGSASMPPPPVPTKVGQADAASTDGNTEDLTINSTTHKQAHARLSRRMAAMGEAECPQMQKLWSGSRKDKGPNKIS